MRTTLILNDELLDKARRLTGLKEKTAMVHAVPMPIRRRSVALTGVGVWTLDRRLATAARRLSLFA